MSIFLQSLRRIPIWAYLPVLLVIFINILFFVYKRQLPEDGTSVDFEKGQWVFRIISPGSPGEKAGLKTGDILVSINSFTIEEWTSLQRVKSGDTAMYTVLRKGKVQTYPVIYSTRNAEFLWFFFLMSTVMSLFSIASLYLLYKKPDDRAVRLFFIYMLCVAVCQNAIGLPFPEILSAFTNIVFNFCVCILGPVLVNFHLHFPKPSKLILRFPWLPVVLYIPGLFLFILYSVLTILDVYYGNPDFSSTYWVVNRIVLIWITLTYILALSTALFQFHEIKETLARNQLRIVIMGSFFALVTPIGFTFFNDILYQLQNYFPFIMEVFSALGAMILVACCLIAIFRYRIWDIEVVIRKALLYLGATAVIILTYLLIIWLVDQFAAGTTDLIRFASLGVSVILFLVLRDRIQRLIDRLFHRENYDSATVVSDFEAKLAGIYRLDELKEKIVRGLDDIFHFKSFVFSLKKENLVYGTAYVFGIEHPAIPGEFPITSETEEKLRGKKVFSPGELSKKPPILEEINGDLVIPLVSNDQPSGFFICGQKKSERIYSRQDINVLTLLAKRVVALLHTANLYQNDLDRQLMLERERARIARDMHDDIGAGLTKIAMISEASAAVNSLQSAVRSPQSLTADCQLGTGNWELETGNFLMERLNRIATSSRDMISRLNVIVWALNPKYDNLESLISYLRRYFGEYLENFDFRFITDLPEVIPEISITPDTRRNIFYSVQEAIHNAVKHSGGTEIKLAVNLDRQNLTITVSDNGKGFDQVRPGAGGNGLLNMKRRAEEMGGSFLLNSSPGSGTNVSFTIRLLENTTKW